MIKPLITLLASTIFLGGCSVFAVGEDPSCPGLPNGVTCKSAKEVYLMTNHRSHLENMTEEEAAAIEAKAFGNKRAVTGKQESDDGFMSYFTPDSPEESVTAHHNHNDTAPIPRSHVDTGMNVDSFKQMEMLQQQNMLRDEQSIMRTQSKVLRLKFAKWEDDNGRLHDPGKIYIEVEGRKWIVGSKKVQTMPIITPLQIRDMSLEEIRKKQNSFE